TFCMPPDSMETNEILAFNGATSTSPNTPHVAFTFYFLETYCQLHHVCLQLSFDAISCTLMNLHKHPHNENLVRQLSSMYNIYLLILCFIESDVQAVLRQNQEAVQAQLICAPCMYRLEGEVPLNPSMLFCCDGNNSLKLINEIFQPGQPRCDNRQLKSFYFLEPEEVDHFKDDVAIAQAAAKAKRSDKQPLS
ncbi:hypothetical protein FISHEDRAFT_5241, partial [Fistulina hepatica ATCC 64428]